MARTKDVFVIMPFSTTKSRSSRKWTEIYENMFLPSFEELGYPCSRAQPLTGNLLGTILEKLRYAWVVLADITDGNRNVFYELGIRHSLSQRTIVVAHKSQHVPSDLRGYWWLEYGTQPAQVVKFKADIKRIMAEIEVDPDRSDSPVSDFLRKEFQSIDSHIQRENVKKLTALFTELSGNLIAVTGLTLGRKDGCLISYECLDLLLNTLYIDPGPQVLSRAYELRQELRRIVAGELEHDRLMHVRKEIDLLAQTVKEIEAHVRSGEFTEPSSVSAMVWDASSTQFETGSAVCLFSVGVRDLLKGGVRRSSEPRRKA